MFLEGGKQPIFARSLSQLLSSLILSPLSFSLLSHSLSSLSLSLLSISSLVDIFVRKGYKKE